MQNVAGISQTEAQKSSDMFMKCRYMDELTGGRGIIFATGTLVSNSMTELYTMQRYLQFDKLRSMGLQNFDAWASTFGETTTALELAPEGTGFRAKTRFSKFFNLPELMKTFKDVADIKTADMLNLPRPKANFHVVPVKPTEEQRQLVGGLSERASRVHSRQVRPEEDNMLKITSDGRKIGLDQRLMNTLLPDDPGSKVNTCVRNVFQIWQDTQADRLTQLIFCDFSTPGKDKGFNVYDDIKQKLIASGVPESEKRRNPCANGIDAKNGSRDERTGQTDSPSRFGLPVATSGLGTASGKNNPTRQPECRSKYLPVCNGKHV